MKTLWQDLRYGIRMLLRSRGFTTVAIVALALGIGANSAIFSVLNAVLLRSLPYKDPGRLVMVGETRRKGPEGPTNPSYPNFVDWRDQNQVFEAMAAAAAVSFGSQGFDLTGGGQPEKILGLRVSASFFPLLDVKPVLGRTFLSEEQEPGKERIVLMSYSLWQRRFGGDPNFLGKTLILNGEPYTLVGIMPADFQFTPYWYMIKAELWVPLTPDPNRRRGYLYVLARLKPEVTRGQAQAEMDSLARRLEQAYPETNTSTGVKLVPLHEQLAQAGVTRPALLLFLTAVGFVLLIACANVAQLLLARATARKKETAIRAALGASRWRIIRQLLTESLLLGLLGGALGLLLAVWGVDLLVAGIPQELGVFIPSFKDIHLDLNVLAFTLGVSVLTSLVFGLAPALEGSHPDLNQSLKEGGNWWNRHSCLSTFNRRGAFSTLPGLFHFRVRSLLVVSEVALSLVLLIGAGLMMNSFWRLQAVKPGFNPENLLSMRIDLPQPKYPASQQRGAFYQQVLRRIETLPAVRSVGVINTLPISGERLSNRFTIEGLAEAPEEVRTAGYCSISPNYLSTMGIPLLKGRPFTEPDRKDAPRVVIINEAMASRFWPNKDPIGQRLRIGNQPETREIVGVLANVRHLGLNAEPRPEIYAPFWQSSDAYMYLVVRTALEPSSLAAAVRREVWAVDKDLPLAAVKTVNQVISDSIALRRFSMLLLGIFAAVALVLAAVGIYGVMFYSVTQRTHEIGIRMALGAQQRDVLKLVVGQGMTLALVGVAIGLAAAFLLTRLMSSFLFGISATDPATFAVISILLAGVALLACYLPARRATQVDPMVALRYE